MSYVNDIYLMVSLVREMGAENIEKKEENRENKNKKKEKEKKNEKNRESKITKINTFGFTSYIKIIFCLKA